MTNYRKFRNLQDYTHKHIGRYFGCILYQHNLRGKRFGNCHQNILSCNCHMYHLTVHNLDLHNWVNTLLNKYARTSHFRKRNTFHSYRKLTYDNDLYSCIAGHTSQVHSYGSTRLFYRIHQNHNYPGNNSYNILRKSRLDSPYISHFLYNFHLYNDPDIYNDLQRNHLCKQNSDQTACRT